MLPYHLPEAAADHAMDFWAYEVHLAGAMTWSRHGTNITQKIQNMNHMIRTYFVRYRVTRPNGENRMNLTGDNPSDYGICSRSINKFGSSRQSLYQRHFRSECGTTCGEDGLHVRRCRVRSWSHSAVGNKEMPPR